MFFFMIFIAIIVTVAGALGIAWDGGRKNSWRTTISVLLSVTGFASAIFLTRNSPEGQIQREAYFREQGYNVVSSTRSQVIIHEEDQYLSCSVSRISGIWFITPIEECVPLRGPR